MEMNIIIHIFNTNFTNYKFTMYLFILSLLSLRNSNALLENEKFTVFPHNFSLALRDITAGMICKSLTIFNLLGEDIGLLEFQILIASLHGKGVATIYFNSLKNSENKQKYMDYLSKGVNNTMEITSLIFCKPLMCESVLNEIKEKNFFHRYVLYIFYWGGREASGRFLSGLHEAMRIAVITNPRPNTFRLYYNQGPIKDSSKPLVLVNWWINGKLYQTPSLPMPVEVYSNMRKRIFSVPVLHAPPWYYVKLVNKSTIEVTGGRDHQLLSLLANKLNFRYRYFDPPQHSQGSGVTANGSFIGVLGMIYRREADFFLGDVSISWERQRGIEFSFLTLADNGAFLTRARRKHGGALALLRPFHWQVWPLIIATIIVSGPALWLSAVGPAAFNNKQKKRPSFGKCIWFTMSIFLKQNCRLPSSSLRIRIMTILLSFGATYVISDLYSGMLTSLMARPTMEPPLSTLTALEEAMRFRGYHLLVERHSASLAILQNGTGVYGKLWNLMSLQSERTVKSVEKGVKRILQHQNPPVALLAGRETLFFNTKKYGVTNFQLSKKLYTRYSAIAMQIGCPYIENFNRVLMQLFESGLLDKMTSQEYERFKGDTDADEILITTTNEQGDSETDNTNIGGNTQHLEAVNMNMLQGAFYILFLGYVTSVANLSFYHYELTHVSFLALILVIEIKVMRDPDIHLWLLNFVQSIKHSEN